MPSNSTPETEFLFINNQARTPSSLNYGQMNYRHMAVVEVIKGYRPNAIDPRRKGIVHIVDRERCIYVGSTKKSEGFRRMRELDALAVKLNGGEQLDLPCC